MKVDVSIAYKPVFINREYRSSEPPFYDDTQAGHTLYCMCILHLFVYTFFHGLCMTDLSNDRCERCYFVLHVRLSF